MAKSIGGLTEGRMKNSRFRKTEEAFLLASMRMRRMAMADFLRAAKVSRSTFYFHHRNMAAVITDNKNFLIRKWRRLAGRMMRRQYVSVLELYLALLYFVLANKKIFFVFYRRRDHEVLEKMVERLRGMLVAKMRLAKSKGWIFDVYKMEIVAVVELWEKDGCQCKKIPEVVGKMMYLTETVAERLGKM